MLNGFKAREHIYTAVSQTSFTHVGCYKFYTFNSMHKGCIIYGIKTQINAGHAFRSTFF